MNKNYIAVALGAMVVALPFAAAAQMNSSSANTGTQASASASNSRTSADASFSESIGWGSSGSDVESLQRFLMDRGYLHSSATGYFGARTRVAVKAFQRAYGIPASGYAGPITIARINALLGASGSGSSNMSMPMTDTKAADLRVLLNVLERQHVDLASAATRDGFDGAPSYEAAAKELDKNSVALSQAVASVYGPDAGAKFLEIWRSHITFFVNYTIAAKKGDKAGMDKAVADLGGYVNAISDFFSKANPNLPYDAVHQLVSQHVSLLKAAVDTYGAGDYAGSYAKQTEAYNQIGTIADGTAGAIVKQYPQKF